MKAGLFPIYTNTAILNYNLVYGVTDMSHRITLIPGDGVGPEITAATVRVLKATGVQFDWEPLIVGEQALKETGTPLPDAVLDSIRKNKVALKGPVTTPIGTGFRSVNVALRKRLDLYSCLRPCKTYPGAPAAFPDVDIVVVRENTEDLYAGVEFAVGTDEASRLIELVCDTGQGKIRDDSGFSIKMISRAATRRIVRFAFDYARANGRKKVSAVTKANILKFSDGLFLQCAREVAAEYPGIDFEEVLIDALCMQLVRNPQRFDVLVLPNLYGDIISDLCAGLVGGLGLAPGANIGDDCAVFEPTHGSAPKYKGMNKVNPMAMMLSSVLMLHHLGEDESADRLEAAIAAVIAEGKHVTYDMRLADGYCPSTTSEVADTIIARLKGNSSA
jgi:isocitrate dehydrogenase (NAD+)